MKWTIPLRSLKDADLVIIEFLTQISTQCGSPVKFFHFDQGSCYLTNRIKNYYSEKGITIEPTATDCHQQNGKLERFMRSSLDSVRTILSQSGLPLHLWDEALMYYVYTINRVSTTHDQISPQELWDGNKPSITHLHRFGEPCYPHVMAVHQHSKLEPRATTCVFVGYDLSTPAYRVLDTVTNTIMLSAHVDFLHDVIWPTITVSPFAERTFPDAAAITTASDTDFIPLNTPDQCSIGAETTTTRGSGDTPKPTVLPAVVNTPPKSRSPQSSPTTLQIDKPTFTYEEATTNNTTAPTRSLIHPSNIISGSRRSQSHCANQPAALIAGPRRQSKTHKVILRTDQSQSNSDIPRRYRDISGRLDESSWRDSMQRELDGLRERNYGTLVPRSEAFKAKARVFPTRWVYTVKMNGTLKSRQVVMGNLQTDDDAPHTYAPTASSAAFKVLIQITAQEDLELKHYDVNQAFLQADIDGVVFVEQAEGFKVTGKEDWVILLNKSLYGLRQAPYLWHKTISEYLASEGFTSSPADACLFVKETGNVKFILLLHVDDFAVAASDGKELNHFYSKLNTRFGVRDEGDLKRFLSYQVVRNRAERTILLHQNDYIVETLEAANMSHCAVAPNPGDLYRSLSSADSPTNDGERDEMSRIPYRELMGSLNQLAMTTRPDIAHHVTSLSRFNNNPGRAHWKAAKQLLKYLKGTSKMGLLYDGSDNRVILRGWVDASLASCSDTGHSVGAYFFSLGSAAVSWRTKFMPQVHPSSTESEIAALYMATSEAVWLRKLLEHLGYKQSTPTVLFEDNQGAIKYTNIDDRAGRMRHIDVKFFFTREQTLQGNIVIKYIKSAENHADMLTKPLTGSQFLTHRLAMGIQADGVGGVLGC